MSVVSISTEKGTHREEARSLSCLGREELEKMAGNLTGSAKTKKSNFFLKKIASRDTSTKITYSDNFEDRQ